MDALQSENAKCTMLYMLQLIYLQHWLVTGHTGELWSDVIWHGGRPWSLSHCDRWVLMLIELKSPQLGI